MEKLENQTVFKCSYCSRISMSAAAMHKHEINCRKNPERQAACVSCKHMIKEERERTIIPELDCKHCLWFNYETQSCRDRENCVKKVEVDFICSKTGKKMYYHPAVMNMNKKKRELIISRCDHKMPKDCEMQECDV